LTEFVLVAIVETSTSPIIASIAACTEAFSDRASSPEGVRRKVEGTTVVNASVPSGAVVADKTYPP
jgi:hypothetical protein